jgi:DNA-binding NarL/FixJ family response regulator
MTDGGAVRVLVADDQKVVREGLTLLLGLLPGIEVVGSAVDGDDAVRQAVATAPDIVLMDLDMPRCDGVEATRRLAREQPRARVVVLTTFSDDASVFRALRAGALGFLTKDAGAQEIQQAITTVAAGQAQLDPSVQRRLLEALARGALVGVEAASGAPAVAGAAGAAGAAAAQPSGRPSPATADALTPREVEVLGLIAAGLSNGEIARSLVVSEATVKTHVNHLLAKTGLRDRAQLVGFAFRAGLAG